jgi:hypothetical protein
VAAFGFGPILHSLAEATVELIQRQLSFNLEAICRTGSILSYLVCQSLWLV